MTLRHLRVIAISVLAVIGIAGWTAMTFISQPRAAIARAGDDLRSHVEAVFRMQNVVLDELVGSAERSADSQTADANKLYAAEDRLVASCQQLNEAASISADGGEPGMYLKLRVLGSIGRCEASAKAARALLRTDGGIISVSSQ